MAVKKPDFDKCEQDDPINMYFQGPTILELTKPGDYYYYDGIGKHCEAGMKLHIVVGTKEGSSGENMPFKLDTFVIRTSSLTTTSAATAPAAAASGPSATVSAASSGPSATVSAASTGPSASASATAAAPKASAATATHKLGFGVMLVAMALSMFLLVWWNMLLPLNVLKSFNNFVFVVWIILFLFLV